MLKRITFFIYGLAAYALFFGTFLYAIGFVGNILVPAGIDGEPTWPFWQSFALDAALLGIFAVQHTTMARPGFKRWWTQFIPQEIERSTYVLIASLLLIAMFAHWKPLGGVVWSVVDPAGQVILWGIFALGWATVLVSTFLINHFDLFGLRQVWLQLIGRPYTALTFKTPLFYRFVRHPLYVGWFMAFWGTPTMTVTHLVFAIATTVYILIAIQFEERDLLDMHPEYRDYRDQVPMLFPKFGESRRPGLVN